MSTAATPTTATGGEGQNHCAWGVRLAGEASPTEEAKNEQHENNDEDDPKNRHVIPSLGAFGHLFPVGSSLQHARACAASPDGLLAEAYGNPAKTAIIGDGDTGFSRGHSVSSTARRSSRASETVAYI